MHLIFFVPPLDTNEGRWEEHSKAMTLKKISWNFKKKTRKSISSLYAKKSHAASDAGVSLKSWQICWE